MKGKMFIFREYDQDNFTENKRMCKVITEPYAVISSRYGSPERSGLVTSNTSSTTCVSIQMINEGDTILHDISVHNLEPTYTELELLSMYGTNFDSVYSLYEHVKGVLESAKYLSFIEWYNNEVDKILASINNCKPQNTNGLTEKLKYFYLDGCYGVGAKLESSYYSSGMFTRNYDSGYRDKLVISYNLPELPEDAIFNGKDESCRHWATEGWYDLYKIEPYQINEPLSGFEKPSVHRINVSHTEEVLISEEADYIKDLVKFYKSLSIFNLEIPSC